MFKNKALRYSLISLLVVMLGSGGWFAIRYPGITKGSMDNFFNSKMVELTNLTYCVMYWIEFMGYLRWDENQDAYTFDGVDESSLDAFERGQLAFHRGDFETAITLMEEGITTKGESENRLFWLALTHMRQAETVNCLDMLNTDNQPNDESDHIGMNTAMAMHGGMHGDMDHSRMCSLPLVIHHTQKEHSTHATEKLTRLLDKYDSDNTLYRWLLNFSYMTLDAYPAGVPEKYRLDNSFIDAFYGEGADQIAQKHADIQFRDRAAEMGIALNDTGRGVAVEDFDQDGDLDIVTGGAFHDVRFFRNDFQNSGGFLDHTDETGLKDVRQPFFISSADYNNDGFVDLLVARPFATSRLFRNENGVFRDVTEETGLFADKDPDAITPTWNIAWGDVDLDGDLDLFLAHWGMAIPFVSGLLAKPRLSSMLYINEGGRFTDQTRAFGLHDVVHDAYFIGAAFGDYDGDRYPDLLISSPLRKTTILMRNLEGRGFKDSGLVHFPESGFTSAFVDVNHDGRLDIFRAGFGDAQTNTAQIVFREKLDLKAGRSTIMLQTEDGRFEPHDEFFGGDFPVSTMGASFGDLNMDGCHDFYLGSGNPEPWFILPNMMYLGQTNGSDCTGAMTNISMLNGFGTIQKGHGIVFFDFDEDGDQDIYSALGGMWPADAWPNQFFVNEGENANSWIKLRLRGRRTNYYGVGAKITVHASNASGEPIVRTWHMDNKTGFGSAPYIAHIGLYDATSIDRIEVDWPVSGCKGVYQAELGGPGSQPILLDEASCLQTAQESRDSSNKTSAGGR